MEEFKVQNYSEVNIIDLHQFLDIYDYFVNPKFIKNTIRKTYYM